jgi:hypothetical protein
MAAFLANVGVNSAHAARSPLVSDGRFVLLPTPERDPWAPPMLRLGDISWLAAHARHEAEAVFGPTWHWRSARSELQTIGSYTRAVRRVEGLGEEWLRNACLS